MENRVRPENVRSDLLTAEENQLVFRMVGARRFTLATAVVQLFTTDGPRHDQWKHRDTGVLCFIKDNHRRSYFFSIYCLERKTLIWEHEIYTQIAYLDPLPFFHTFEAQESMAAFNFASTEEALAFKKCMFEKIERNKRRAERRSKAESRRISNKPQPKLNVVNDVEVRDKSKIFGLGQITLLRNKSKKNRTIISKEDIGTPHNFVHVYGSSKIDGWNKGKLYDIDNLIEQLDKGFFTQAGISENQLNDRQTREFICDFMNANSHVEIGNQAGLTHKPSNAGKTIQNIKSDKNLEAPRNGREALKPVMTSTRIQGLNSIAVKNVSDKRPELPKSGFVPPSPTAVTTAQQFRLPVVPQRPISTSPGTKRSQAPLPPPMPPAETNSPTPPPPPMAGPLSAPKLQSRTPKPIPTALPPGTVDKLSEAAGDGRANLLEEIRKGRELKTVTVTEADREVKVTNNGLASALAVALQERSKALRRDSNSDIESSTSGEEWMDD